MLFLKTNLCMAGNTGSNNALKKKLILKKKKMYITPIKQLSNKHVSCSVS